MKFRREELHRANTAEHCLHGESGIVVGRGGGGGGAGARTQPTGTASILFATVVLQPVACLPIEQQSRSAQSVCTRGVSDPGSIAVEKHCVAFVLHECNQPAETQYHLAMVAAKTGAPTRVASKRCLPRPQRLFCWFC